MNICPLCKKELSETEFLICYPCSIRIKATGGVYVGKKTITERRSEVQRIKSLTPEELEAQIEKQMPLQKKKGKKKKKSILEEPKMKNAFKNLENSINKD